MDQRGSRASKKHWKRVWSKLAKKMGVTLTCRIADAGRLGFISQKYSESAWFPPSRLHFFTKIPLCRQKGSESDIVFTFFNVIEHYQSLLLYSKNKCMCWQWQIPYKYYRNGMLSQGLWCFSLRILSCLFCLGRSIVDTRVYYCFKASRPLSRQ